MNAEQAKKLSEEAPDIQAEVKVWLEHIRAEIEKSSRIGKTIITFPSKPKSGSVVSDNETSTLSRQFIEKILKSEGYDIYYQPIPPHAGGGGSTKINWSNPKKES